MFRFLTDAWHEEETAPIELAKLVPPARQGKEPANNDGRERCWWCGGRTKSVQSFSSKMDVCKECGR